MDASIMHIVRLILYEAERVKNPDQVSRISVVCGKVDEGIIEVMEQIREQERKQGGDKL